MSNLPKEKRKRKNTSSGHGALGMGGQPSEDPRDLESGGGDRPDDDRSAPVPGAFGEGRHEEKQGGTPEL
jgi:hypothetical protein